MTAERRTAPGLGSGALARLDAAWRDGVERWAGLSSCSRIIVVEGTGHYVHLDRPDLVVAELLALLSPSSPSTAGSEVDRPMWPTRP